MSSHICVCEGNPFIYQILTSVRMVLPCRPDECTGTLKSVRTCCHDVWTYANLNCSKLLNTDGRPDGFATLSGQMLLTE
jgi:hypothetical protein